MHSLYQHTLTHTQNHSFVYKGNFFRETSHTDTKTKYTHRRTHTHSNTHTLKHTHLLLGAGFGPVLEQPTDDLDRKQEVITTWMSIGCQRKWMSIKTGSKRIVSLTYSVTVASFSMNCTTQ